MTIQRRLNVPGQGGNWTAWTVRAILDDAGWTTVSSGSGGEGFFGAGWAFAGVNTGDSSVRPSEEDLVGPPIKIRTVGIAFGSEILGNGECWFLMRSPTGDRELCFQRTGTRSSGYDGYWGIYYSPASGFTGGTAGTRPTASDEHEIHDILAQLWQAGSGSPNNLIHAAADDAASPLGEYGFVVLELVATNTTRSIVWLDDLRAELPASDPEPLVVGAESMTLLDSNMVSRKGWAHVDVGGPGEAWERIGYAWPYVNGQAYELVGGASKYDGAERPIPLHAVDPDIGGHLGASRWFQAAAVAHGYPNTGGGQAHLFVNDTMIKDFWDGASTPSTI